MVCFGYVLRFGFFRSRRKTKKKGFSNQKLCLLRVRVRMLQIELTADGAVNRPFQAARWPTTNLKQIVEKRGQNVLLKAKKENAKTKNKTKGQKRDNFVDDWNEQLDQQANSLASLSQSREKGENKKSRSMQSDADDEEVPTWQRQVLMRQLVVLNGRHFVAKLGKLFRQTACLFVSRLFRFVFLWVSNRDSL